MLERMKKVVKKEKGFTLVELLAVIAILGIVLAIAIPSVSGLISSAEDDADEANIELIENAARLADLSGDFTPDMTVDELVSNGYLEEEPKKPGDEESTYDGTISEKDDGSFSYSNE